VSSFRTVALTSAISLALLMSAAHANTTNPNGAYRFLTGPQQGQADTLALAYFGAQRQALGLSLTDVDDMLLKDDYVTRHNGVRHLYWRQRHQGIEVWNADLAVNVAADGSIINLHNAFVQDLASKAHDVQPNIDAAAAIGFAATALGNSIRAPLMLLRQEGGSAQKALYSGAGISADDIPVQLIYQPSADGRSVRLAWDMVIRETDNANWWSLRIDAQTGELIGQVNFTSELDADKAAPSGTTAYQYRVFPFPFENPDQTAHLLVNDPQNLVASPFGWHDTNGVAGPEFTDTRGNNVAAQDDLDGNNSGGSRPTGIGSNPLVFDIAFNAAADPEVGSNLNAAIVNLFYWNNIMHDVTYQYGFDEPAGNFQTNNYGNGGLGNDSVIADALDALQTGSNNNANFGTPSDGSQPRMQMFRWLAPVELLVNSPAPIAGLYAGSAAGFGPIFNLAGLTGNLQLVDDGVAPTGDSCTASPAGSLTGKIAILDRGSCEFGLKVLNAQNAGAIAAIVVNNVSPGTIPMGPGVNGASVTIRSMMVGLNDGNLIKAQLPAPGVNVNMRSTLPHRDSDMDAGIIDHEYGHGISNRLTGGPSNASCLATNLAGGAISEQGGEGWSDFWALVLHAKPSDTATTPRFVGTYSSFQTAAGPGIRNFPYSTDPLVSPQTYADVAATNAPHGVGEIWAGALWNLYWEMVGTYGYDANLYTGTGGNNRTIQLVIDGMKLQPCSPTMVAARDAILAADQADNAGVNSCAIWRAFAAKGLGVNAVGGAFARGDEVADATIPGACSLSNIFANGFEN
jgi:extracellular elastinolytic metalloproteinase